MPVFIVQQITGHEAILGEEESSHLVKVLRMKKKDPVDLVDGKGNLYRGIIESADAKTSRISIRETIRDHLAREYSIHLGIAPTKSAERFEWFLEKSTEIGIDEITPVYCSQSERNRIRHERSERIIKTAMKQSGRAFLPKLNAMVPLEQFLDHAVADIKYIAYCRSAPDSRAAKPEKENQSWLVLIGPEGDFTEEEVRRANEMGFNELSLGEAVYRTETAGIMACQLIHFLHK